MSTVLAPSSLKSFKIGTMNMKCAQQKFRGRIRTHIFQSLIVSEKPGETAQRLRVLDAFPKELGSNTHTVLITISNSGFRGSSSLFFGHCMHTVNRQIYSQHSHTLRKSVTNASILYASNLETLLFMIDIFRYQKSRSSQAWWYTHLESQHTGGPEARLTTQQLHYQLGSHEVLCVLFGDNNNVP